VDEAGAVGDDGLDPRIADWDEKVRPTMPKCPVERCSLFTHTALTVIHTMGNRPNATPSNAPLTAWPSGMR
jgi:hypothetical protein